MDNTGGVNKELLHDFLDESIEGLELSGSQLVRLESEPGNIGSINDIFRPVHSLKGNAAYFGLLKVKDLAHAVENVLDAMRYRRLPVTVETIGTILPGIDLLGAMLSRVGNGEDECPDPHEYDATVASIKKVLAGHSGGLGGNGQQTLQALREKLSGLADAVPGNLSDIVREALAMVGSLVKHDAGGNGRAETPKRPDGESQKKLSELLGSPVAGKANEEYVDRVVSLLGKILEETDSIEIKTIVKDMSDEIDLFIHTDVGFDNLLRESLIDKLRMLEGGAPDRGATGPDVQPAAGSRTQNEKAQAAREKTMRISEKSVDSFLEYVGELVVVEEMFTYLWKRLQSSGNGMSKEFRKTLDAFVVLADRLRTGILSIRKVEAGVLLQKVPRIVRDIASKTGKRIAVSCSGEDVKIDKSYIDTLDASLTHMIRNAADHGIETVEKRVAAGKNPEGTVTVSIKETDNGVEIMVGDDGGGLDRDAIRKKARSLGLIGANDLLTEAKIIDLIFASGLSTTETVSEISGRGVGMDVVRRAVDAANGKISVESKEGSGCTFTITLPKSISTQIFEGYLVRMTNDEVYVLPLLSILEAFSLPLKDIATVAGKGEYVVRHGRTLPVIRLADKFGYAPSGETDRRAGPEAGEESATFISMMVKGCKRAIMVEEIIGVQKVVSKPIDGLEYDSKYFDGASMMGDGSIAMIISEEGLCNLVD